MTHSTKLVLGQEISDEDGWRVVVAVESTGVWTMDKHGAETFETVEVA